MGAWHGAICVASRSMIISGKSVWNAKREVEESKDKSELIKNTWPRLFKQNGYNTYMTGKWHVQLPIEKIFDSIINKRPGMPDDNRGLFAEGLGNGKKSQEMLKIFLNTCQLDMEGLLMNLIKLGILMILFMVVFGKGENIGVKY